jgi:hypothetical protein
MPRNRCPSRSTYTRELHRLYGVLDRAWLAAPSSPASTYSIADIACYPWIVPHAGHGQSLADFPTSRAGSRRSRSVPRRSAPTTASKTSTRVAASPSPSPLPWRHAHEGLDLRNLRHPVRTIARAPPAHCPICEDDRQYVGPNGQSWTTHDALANRFRLRIEDDEGVLGIGIDGAFGIPQRALFLPTDAGNLLWECVSLVTDDALDALRARGGVERIVISHPHFYSSIGRVERRAGWRRDPVARSGPSSGSSVPRRASGPGAATRWDCRTT